MLEISHLRKSFGPLVAVDDVSFSLAKGQLVGLLGPNGAGKTTTVSMIAGLLTPERGEVRIGGHCLAGDTDPFERRIGLVPQSQRRVTCAETASQRPLRRAQTSV